MEVGVQSAVTNTINLRHFKISHVHFLRYHWRIICKHGTSYLVSDY